MAMRYKVKHHGCDVAAQMKRVAERALQASPSEDQMLLLALIDRNYGLWELEALTADLVDQLERIPDEAPNRPLRAMMQDVVRVTETIDERVRPMARQLGLREAA